MAGDILCCFCILLMIFHWCHYMQFPLKSLVVVVIYKSVIDSTKIGFFYQVLEKMKDINQLQAFIPESLNKLRQYDISLQDTSAEAREKQAKQLFAFAKENNISGLMQEIDTSGRTSFGELDEGIYLLAQIGNVESGTDKFESAPFLVNIPSEINGNVEYNVTIEPKAEWVSSETPPSNPDKPKDPTPSKPDKPNTIQKIINTVKTGDTTNIVAWFLIAIVSLGLIVGLYKKRKMK